MKTSAPQLQKWFPSADSDKKITRSLYHVWAFLSYFIFNVIHPPAKQTKYSGLRKPADWFVTVSLALSYVMHQEAIDECRCPDYCLNSMEIIRTGILGPNTSLSDTHEKHSHQ